MAIAGTKIIDGKLVCEGCGYTYRNTRINALAYTSHERSKGHREALAKKQPASDAPDAGTALLRGVDPAD